MIWQNISSTIFLFSTITLKLSAVCKHVYIHSFMFWPKFLCAIFYECSEISNVKVRIKTKNMTHYSSFAFKYWFCVIDIFTFDSGLVWNQKNLILKSRILTLRNNLTARIWSVKVLGSIDSNESTLSRGHYLLCEHFF